MAIPTNVDLVRLREALEASWDKVTSYQNVGESGNSALGQCYPTSRVIQTYIPAAEIVEGEVLTDSGTEKHFWNAIDMSGQLLHIDFTWSQFPHGSMVKKWKIRNRKTLGDSSQTIERVEILLERVKKYLNARS